MIHSADMADAPQIIGFAGFPIQDGLRELRPLSADKVLAIFLHLHHTSVRWREIISLQGLIRMF